MKILFVGDILEEGKHAAPLLVASNLFSAFYKGKHDVRYFTYFKEGTRYSYRKKIFGKEVISKTPAIVKFGLVQFIVNVIRVRPQIIYLTNIEFFYLFIFPLKYFLKYRIIYTLHGLLHYEIKHFRKNELKGTLKGRFIERMIFRYCDKVLFLSEKISRLSSLNFKIKENKREIVDNGITMEDSCKYYISRLQGLLKMAVIASSSNGERKEKGLDLLLQYLLSSSCDYEVNVYGNRDKFSKELGNVRLNCYPFQNEQQLSEALISNDIVIVPSRYEPFNIGLLKAMGLGMIFLSSDRVGLAERFDSSLNQFVYRYNGEEDFNNKLNYIKQMDVEELNYYSSYIRNFANHFPWDKISHNYIEIFNEIR